MQQITDLPTLHATLRHWRPAGHTIALVPTMGALHAGHLSLVKAAQAKADKVVVSIFVNPTQFGPNEDFDRYPRPLAHDIALLESVGADALWLPSVATMYPQGFATTVHVDNVTQGLCGASRPTHFDGVATIVSKLLLQVLPDLACFGEKDYQQVCVIERLVKDLNIPVTIAPIPTLREADGLALSSRNQYLSEAERALAPRLYAVLNETAATLRALPAQATIAPTLEQGKAALLAAGFASVEYLELRAARNLAPLSTATAPARLLSAARLGNTRLIDNIAL